MTRAEAQAVIYGRLAFILKAECRAKDPAHCWMHGIGGTKTDVSHADKGNSLGKWVDEKGNLLPEREALHQEIAESFFKGVTPHEGKAELLIMGGGPAAGKSTSLKVGAIKPTENSVMIDSDKIKAMLPEYNEMIQGDDWRDAAYYCHEESSALAKRILGIAESGNYNATLDGTGDGELNSLLGKIEDARARGYTIRGEYVTRPTDDAWASANARAEKTRRYVVEDVVRSTHRKVSAILPDAAPMFDSIKLYDNTVNGVSTLIAEGGGGQGLTAAEGQESAFKAFLDKANE